MSKEKNNDIISLCLKHGAVFSDLDNETKDNLIKEICSRILNIECEKREIFSIKKSKIKAT